MSNGRTPARRVNDLIEAPSERLDVELKEWLDIQGNNAHRALVAKELIALANHGGGFLIFGFAEHDNGSIGAQNTPENLSDYTTDRINGIVQRYAEPAFNCEVEIGQAETTGTQHAVVIVPGGHRIPIRSKRGGPDGENLRNHTYYIRRSGPASEAPNSAHEWDTLIRQCVANARSEMLDQIRGILAGGGPVEPIGSNRDTLHEWMESSEQRWSELAADLPEDDPARLNLGAYSVGYRLQGDFDPPRGRALRDSLAQYPQFTGWPPFWVPTRPEIAPQPSNGGVECWIGPNAYRRDPGHSDYWRVSQDAEFYLKRGYQEDSPELRDVTPGTIFDITLPLWRVGEVLLHAAAMGRIFGDPNSTVSMRWKWSGLTGRRLQPFANPLRYFSTGGVGSEAQISSEIDVTASEIDAALPEIVGQITRPLYENFDFFEMPEGVIVDELARMRGRR